MQENGIGTAIVSGGTEPYEYLWSTGATTSSIVDQSAGTYTVTVTDANDCHQVQEISIDLEFTPVFITVTTTSNPLACFGDTNAAISLEIVGGLEHYTITWAPATADLSALEAGDYAITVSDANGQEQNIEVTITQPDELELIAESSPATGDNADGIATATVLGGTSPYEYL